MWCVVVGIDLLCRYCAVVLCIACDCCAVSRDCGLCCWPVVVSAPCLNVRVTCGLLARCVLLPVCRLCAVVALCCIVSVPIVWRLAVACRVALCRRRSDQPVRPELPVIVAVALTGACLRLRCMLLARGAPLVRSALCWRSLTDRYKPAACAACISLRCALLSTVRLA